MQIIIDNKEILTEKIYNLLLEDFQKSLEDTDLSQEEKDANVILAKRKMQADSENLAIGVYRAYGIE